MYLVSISVAVTHIAYYVELTRKQYMKEQFWFHTFSFFRRKHFMEKWMPYLFICSAIIYMQRGIQYSNQLITDATCLHSLALKWSSSDNVMLACSTQSLACLENVYKAGKRILYKMPLSFPWHCLVRNDSFLMKGVTTCFLKGKVV